MLLVDVLRSYMAAGKFQIHDFVVMPNHLHVLLTVGRDMTIRESHAAGHIDSIRGGFSYRLKKEYGYLFLFGRKVWQRGFSEVRIMDQEGFSRCRDYIAKNPVKEGLAAECDEFRYCFTYLTRQEAGAEALDSRRYHRHD